VSKEDGIRVAIIGTGWGVKVSVKHRNLPLLYCFLHVKESTPVLTELQWTCRFKCLNLGLRGLKYLLYFLGTRNGEQMTPHLLCTCTTCVLSLLKASYFTERQGVELQGEPDSRRGGCRGTHLFDQINMHVLCAFASSASSVSEVLLFFSQNKITHAFSNYSSLLSVETSESTLRILEYCLRRRCPCDMVNNIQCFSVML